LLRDWVLDANAYQGRTGSNLELAFGHALEAYARMNIHGISPAGNPKPVITILVSDGSYSLGRSPLYVVKENIIPVDTMVLYTISIGKEMNRDLLVNCAKLGRGTHAGYDSLEEIMHFFSSKARTFGTSKITGKAVPVGTLAETRALEACPKCGKEDFFRSLVSKEGKMVQVVICSVCGYREEKLSV
jgi:predicted RNA-binding Zn-ribbon protein involved in translation (DUF1610 family)